MMKYAHIAEIKELEVCLKVLTIDIKNAQFKLVRYRKGMSLLFRNFIVGYNNGFESRIRCMVLSSYQIELAYNVEYCVREEVYSRFNRAMVWCILEFQEHLEMEAQLNLASLSNSKLAKRCTTILYEPEWEDIDTYPRSCSDVCQSRRREVGAATDNKCGHFCARPYTNRGKWDRYV